MPAVKTMPIRSASNTTYWCHECGHEEPCDIKQSPFTIHRFDGDGGSLGRGMGSIYMVGPVDWRVWPTMRCPCRIAAEKQWEIERFEQECIAWEACGGKWTKSKHCVDVWRKLSEDNEAFLSGWEDED